MQKIVLIGRPNVGKSSLFNRLIRSRRAITHDRPGVTRDRLEGVVRRFGQPAFIVVDTGGLTLEAGKGDAVVLGEGPAGVRGFEAEILRQAEIAVEEAAGVALVVDGLAGLTPFDRHLAGFVRRRGKPTLLVVNKVDGPELAEQRLADFYPLGFELLPVSAEHGFNLNALREALPALLPPRAGESGADATAWADGEQALDGVQADAAWGDAAPFPDEEQADAAWAGEDAREDHGRALVDIHADANLPPDEAGTADDGREDGALPAAAAARPLRLALLGRPNAGKSSLVNALVGEERMIVSSLPGTTRDSVDVRLYLAAVPNLAAGLACPGDRAVPAASASPGVSAVSAGIAAPLSPTALPPTPAHRAAPAVTPGSFIFVDTAGVRRRTRITDAVESFSVNSAIKSSTKADVTLLVIDGSDGPTGQDKRLLALLSERKIPFMVLVNKTDLLQGRAGEAARRDIAAALAFSNHVPVLYVSARTGKGLEQILPKAVELHRECFLRAPTAGLNRLLQQMIEKKQPPVVKRVRPKFFYLTQAETAPPTFVFFVSDAERIKEPYARYLEKTLRKLLGIRHAPVRVHFRSSHKKDD